MGSATSGYAQMTSAQRSLASSAAALRRWAGANSPEARRAGTQAARDAQRSKWARQVDPDGTLSPAELAAAVERLQRAHQRRMTLASAQARSGRARRAP